MGLMDAGGGLSGGKLALANATPEDVLAGKTFYSGDKTLKTGLIPEYGYEPVIQKVGIYNPGDGNRIYFYLPNADTDQQGLGGHVTRSICAPIDSVRPLIDAKMSSESYSGTSFTTTKACKVIVIWAQCNGYKGSSISVSGNGISNVVSADNCTKHSFGEWGSLHCAGFGCNIPKGTTVTVNGSGNLDATRSINVRYFE